MFTGIIKSIGRVEANRSGRLRIKSGLKSATIGASVAVNGACLTVVRTKNGSLEFDLSPETLRLTNLGKLTAGDMVNLEPSLRLGDSLDGHWVTGHVDASAHVLRAGRIEDGCVVLRVELPKALRGLVARKGSVTIDGTSLTATQARKNWFEIVLIPHTLKATNLGSLKPGDLVNLEADPIARYLQSLLANSSPRRKPGSRSPRAVLDSGLRRNDDPWKFQ